VIENYLQRMRDSRPRHRKIKSVVDPSRVRRSATPHHFLYTDGFAVDENRNPLDTPPRSLTKQVSFSLLRVNHYWTRSAEEWARKLENVDAHTGVRRHDYEPKALGDLAKLDQKLDEHHDETITMYAPALREALGMEPAGATRT
jgi:hypothetical protein